MIVLFIIVAILILLLMITIHEFGHYIAGKILGFKIDEFSIGFGPKLFQKKKKNGELFSIRLLPLGGYCAFAGETDEEKILAPEKGKEPFESDADGAEERHSDVKCDEKVEKTVPAKTAENGETVEGKARPNLKFNDQPPWKRIIVLMAGGVFNLLSAVVFSFIFIAVAGVGGSSVKSVLKSVDAGAVSVLQKGDEIVSIDGEKVDFYHSLSDALADKKSGDTMELVVLRNGEEVTVDVKIHRYDPNFYADGSPVDEKDRSQLPIDQDGNTIYPVGLGVFLINERATVGDAFKYCVPYTGKLSWLILGTFGQLIIGKVPLDQVSGPIGTVTQMANYGMQNPYYLLVLLPLIAANLGIFNLFPIPALDGSKVVFTVIEWIRGKPINRKVETMIHFVGLVVLFTLVIVLDIVNLIMGAI